MSYVRSHIGFPIAMIGADDGGGVRANGTLRQRWLGRELRRLREDAGLTLEEAAPKLDWSTSKLSRIETDQQSVDVHGVRSMLDLYDIGGARWTEIIDLIREVRQKGLVAHLRDQRLGLSQPGDRRRRRARLPTRLRTGALQTEDYMRTLFRNSRQPRTEAEVGRDVRARRFGWADRVGGAQAACAPARYQPGSHRHGGTGRGAGPGWGAGFGTHRQDRRGTVQGRRNRNPGTPAHPGRTDRANARDSSGRVRRSGDFADDRQPVLRAQCDAAILHPPRHRRARRPVAGHGSQSAAMTLGATPRTGRGTFFDGSARQASRMCRISDRRLPRRWWSGRLRWRRGRRAAAPARSAGQRLGAGSRRGGRGERYRYMLRTAPPETVEQAHADAFAKLTPEQRRKVLDDLGNAVPDSERSTSDDPQSLAWMATRAEMRQPGTMERTLGGDRGGMGGGMGGMIAGTLLASVAGAFIGTAIADAFLDDEPGGKEMVGGEDTAGAEPAAEPAAEPGGEMGDPGMGDLGGMDGFDI